MAREIVRNSFYITLNTFKRYIFMYVFLAVYFIALFVLQRNGITPPQYLNILITFLFTVVAEMPCFAIFYGKSPLQYIKENTATLLITSLIYSIILFASKYIFSVVGGFASNGVEVMLLSILSGVINVVLYIFFSFALIGAIKSDYGIKETFSVTADALLKDKAYNIGLFVKILFIEIFAVIAFFLVFMLFIGLVSMMVPQSLKGIIAGIATYIFFLPIYPYMCIRMCNCYEELV